MGTTEIQDYHEPFLGTGHTLLMVLSDQNTHIKGTVYASDPNRNIVDLFLAIQHDPEHLIRSTEHLIREGRSLTWVQEKFDVDPSPDKLLFLLGPLDREYVRSASRVLQRVVIQHSSFEDALRLVRSPNDFVFVDVDRAPRTALAQLKALKCRFRLA